MSKYTVVNISLTRISDT